MAIDEAIERAEQLLYEAVKSGRPQDAAVMDAHRILLEARNEAHARRTGSGDLLHEIYLAFYSGELDVDSEVGGLVLDLARYAEAGRASGLANVRLAREREYGTCHVCFEPARATATVCDACGKDLNAAERERERSGSR